MSKEMTGPETGGPVGAALSRRGFLKLSGAGLVGAALLGVAGCGGDGGGQQGGGQSGGGNSLTVGIDQEPAVLNRLLGEGQLQVTNDTTAGIVEAPLAVQPDLSYEPRLAEAMPEVVSESPLVIQYRLKENLTWSDGEPLTSADARWTYEQIINPDNQIALRTGWQDIGKFETPDERTVRITFEQPYAPWRNLLTEIYPILPRHVYEGRDFNKALNNEIVGSGPFKLEEWRKGQSLRVVRNDNYWGEKPALDSVTYRFITDTNTLIASLQSGEVQFINPPPDIGLKEKLDGIDGAKNESAAGVVWEYIGINVEKVSNLKMRQALAYGINRQQVVDEILQGSVNPLQSVIMPQQEPYYEPAWERYSYDPARARRLSREAVAEGASATVSITTTTGNALRETLEQIVQDQLKDAGITLKIANESATTLFSETMPGGDFELAEDAWLSTPDPATITQLYSADQIPPGGTNYTRYNNEQVTRLLKQADTTVDVERRAEILREVQNRLAEDLPVIPLFQRPVTIAYSENLQGARVNPTQAGPYWNMGEWSLG